MFLKRYDEWVEHSRLRVLLERDDISSFVKSSLPKKTKKRRRSAWSSGIIRKNKRKKKDDPEETKEEDESDEDEDDENDQTHSDAPTNDDTRLAENSLNLKMVNNFVLRVLSQLFPPFFTRNDYM